MVMCHWSEGREDWEVKLGSADRQRFGRIDNQGNIIHLGTVTVLQLKRLITEGDRGVYTVDTGQDRKS